MNDEQQTRIDAYLMKLRRSLGELPTEDVNDILREIRSHILDRAEASGGLTNEKLVQILKDLGRPEDIGPLYQAEALVIRARSSFSPSLILRTTMRWAMMSVLGFATFLVGLMGYGLSFGFLFCAILKPFDPRHVGLWINKGFTLGTTDMPVGDELLGWWMIPVGLVLSALFLIGTTRFLRWMLRFGPKRPVGGMVTMTSVASGVVTV
jgi:uncharacterized membrane protein